ncbi:hypothetical protein E2C01_021322 [Portunus trituberculatus]|uniref:Uncharacterized protein n=1 Tax=Portunus trituberculatus TaxID=210409 RepID=A0A5B7E451_PORTR|nr:hypothetical protein [Portunus trituberculatus]
MWDSCVAYGGTDARGRSQYYNISYSASLPSHPHSLRATCLDVVVVSVGIGQTSMRKFKSHHVPL